MIYYLIKIAVTVVLVVAISEVAKRNSLIGALLASIPLISVLAMIWLYVDTNDVGKVSALATSIFWLVIPSLTLFITLPVLLKLEINFYLSMVLSVLATIMAYWLIVVGLHYFGIKL